MYDDNGAHGSLTARRSDISLTLSEYRRTGSLTNLLTSAGNTLGRDYQYPTPDPSGALWQGSAVPAQTGTAASYSFHAPGR